MSVKLLYQHEQNWVPLCTQKQANLIKGYSVCEASRMECKIKKFDQSVFHRSDNHSTFSLSCRPAWKQNIFQSASVPPAQILTSPSIKSSQIGLDPRMDNHIHRKPKADPNEALLLYDTYDPQILMHIMNVVPNKTRDNIISGYETFLIWQNILRKRYFCNDK